MEPSLEELRKEFNLKPVKIKDLDRIEIDEKAMEEALKKTALYQFGEYRKAIEDLKKCVKDEIINSMLRIKKWMITFMKDIMK